MALDKNMARSNTDQAAGIDSFLGDRNAPSDAMLMLGRSVSGDVPDVFSLTEELSEEMPNSEEAATSAWGNKLTRLVDRVKNPCVDRFSCTKEESPEEEPTNNAAWGTKLTSLVEKVKNPCGDGLDTQCGPWRIEIKREDKVEGRDVEENDVKASENPAEREETEDKPSVREPIGDEGIRVTGIDEDDIKVTGMDDDGIKVTGMDAPSTEEPEVETVEPTENKEVSDETWVDRISSQAHNMCTAINDLASSAHACTDQSKERISTFTSQTMDSIRNITTNESEDDAQAEVIQLANITEMALNGDQEDAYIAKEVIGHVKQIEHDKEFSIVEDAKKLMPQVTRAVDKIASDAKPQVKSAMAAISSHAKSAWSFLVEKMASLKASCKESTNDAEDEVEEKTVKTEAVTVAKTIQTEAPTVAKSVKTEAATAKDETFPEEQVEIPDDITTPGLVHDVSSLEESTA
jgi:hypothetical protein